MYNARKAMHFTSADGIHNWVNMGLAYDPTSDFVRYTDGTVNHWYKAERPGVFLQNGHVTAFSFSVIDVDKTLDLANDTHGSKIIVVPFDGASFDRDNPGPGSAGCPKDTTEPTDAGAPGEGGTGGAGGAPGATAGAGGVAGALATAGGAANTGGAGASGGSAFAGASANTAGAGGASTATTAGGSAGAAVVSGTSGAVGTAGTPSTVVSAAGSSANDAGSSGCGCKIEARSPANAARAALLLAGLALSAGLRRRKRRG
jgi:hypothetical protein